MAAGQHNPSRRALLGAAVGIPLVPNSLASSFRRKPESILATDVEGRWAPDQVRGDDAWSEAVRAYRAVEAQLRALERATAGQSAEDEEALQEVYDGQVDAFGGAVRAVMLAPAPDFAAFASKLELFFEHELEPHSVDDEVLAALRADARRLAR